MERRKTRRAAVEIPAVLNTLHEDGGVSRKGPPIRVLVEELSGRGARIRLPLPLRAGTLVQVETAEDLYLGEVCHCRRAGDGEEFVAGMELDCVLHAAADVRALMRALLEEDGVRPSGSDTPQPHVERHDEHNRQRGQENPAQGLGPAAADEGAMENSLHGRATPIELDVTEV
ncbi:MAG: PilZ domain-containing protein [Bryobacteraceae bacterium]|nr:PilZ domain-containing protein [Bryobacteraceae bacterium]